MDVVGGGGLHYQSDWVVDHLNPFGVLQFSLGGNFNIQHYPQNYTYYVITHGVVLGAKINICFFISLDKLIFDNNKVEEL